LETRALFVSNDVLDQARAALAAGIELSPGLRTQLRLTPADAIHARTAALVERAEVVTEMIACGEGSSANVELMAIEDELRFLRTVLNLVKEAR
jgi:hypothetical protein